MKNLLLAFLVVIPCILRSQINRQINISVDDLPTVEYSVEEENHGLKITEGLLEAAKTYNAPLVGFVNASKLYKDGQIDSTKMKFLVSWLEAGHELGNHTFSHLNYHKVAFQEYSEDILAGEKIVKKVVETKNGEYRFFRHPYLRSGRDSLETTRLQEFLKQHGYQEALVTVDNDDYLFALAYARAYKKGDEDQMQQIGMSYIEYMTQKIAYFEKMSAQLFGRNINHTILIHASLLNAHYLGKLLAAYSAKGYSFIDQKAAQEDSAYQTPVTRFGDWGISWLERWTMIEQKSSELFSEDPKVPDFILQLVR
ncbi:MAG: polysaccharide deacetylase family protein [Bacteroidota bacterium]